MSFLRTKNDASEIIRTCIKGEAWPITSFKSYLDLKRTEVTEDSITLICPVGHSFNLQVARQKEVLAQQEAATILAWAKKEFPRVKAEYEQRVAPGRRTKPSEFIPNSEVVAKKWPCVKCGAPAQLAGFPPQKKLASCLDCRAAWSNFIQDNQAAFDFILAHTQRKLRDRFYAVMQERFLAEHLIPMSELEAKELLMRWRKQAQRESSKRAQLKRKKT